jgi:hypothetical protein
MPGILQVLAVTTSHYNNPFPMGFDNPPKPGLRHITQARFKMTSPHAQGERNALPEKEIAMHVERSANGLSPSDDEFLSNFADEDRRKVLRKVR